MTLKQILARLSPAPALTKPQRGFKSAIAIVLEESAQS